MGWDRRFNFDGFLTFSRFHGNYVQLFRSGAIEAVDTTALNVRYTEGIDPQGLRVDLRVLEDRVIEAVVQYMGVLRQINIQTPVFIMVTVVGVKGRRLTTAHAYVLTDNVIDRDVLILPDIMVEELSLTAESYLRPIFDAIAKSAVWRVASITTRVAIAFLFGDDRLAHCDARTH